MKTTNKTTRSRIAKPRAKTQPPKLKAKSTGKTSVTPAAGEKVEVYGIYSGPEQTGGGVQALVEAGFSIDDIKASAIEPMDLPTSQIAEPVRNIAGSGVNEIVGVTARMAGSMLAFGSVPFLAPIMLAGPLVGALFGGSGRGEMRKTDQPAESEHDVLVSINVGDRNAAKRVTKVLERTGAQKLAITEMQDNDEKDLKNREYRDDSGEIHHHTRTFMRDHGKDKLN